MQPPTMVESTLESGAFSLSREDESKSSNNIEQASSSYGEQTSSNGTDSDSRRTGSTSDDDINAIKHALAKQETTQVFRLRLLVIIMLIAAAASISITIFYLTRNAELEQFELQYEGSADKIIGALQEIIVQMSAVSGIAVAATAHIEESGVEGEEWPFVTVNNFQERAGNAKALSGALYVSIYPIVETENLAQWESYVLSDENRWMDEGFIIQENKGLNSFLSQEQIDATFITHAKVDPLHTFDAAGNPQLSTASGPYLPRWQSAPVLQRSYVNENVLEDVSFASSANLAMVTKSAVLGGFDYAPQGFATDSHPTTSFYAELLSIFRGENTEYLGDPISNLFIPIFDRLSGAQREVVGLLRSSIYWQWYLEGILPITIRGIHVVVRNECDGEYTYELRGDKAFPVGFGDLHDKSFDEYELVGQFTTETLRDGTVSGVQLNQEGCPFTFRVYPTQTEFDQYVTKNPLHICLSVASVFAFTLILFLVYDCLVERRQRLVVAKASQSTAIVASLFPKQVRERLLAVESDKRKGAAMLAPSHHVKTFLNSGGDPTDGRNDQPIAELFPHCTILFCDMAGFTAWSSTREPAQVFLLLQTVYQSFDIIAKRRRVFKVETIGDSYLAVTGLPEPQKQHATIMARFAWDCLRRLGEVLSELEVSLGPDTGDLSMRFGLHSGSVTAGVLKGDRARFQLFGDTVNTAARMESTGAKGRIQVSESTAEILKESGKNHWLTPRQDAVEAKGKGTLKTYWLALNSRQSAAASDVASDDVDFARRLVSDEAKKMDKKESRLVNWVTEILMVHIKKVVIVRERCARSSLTNAGKMEYHAPANRICLDEALDAVQMPDFNPKVADAALDFKVVKVPKDIESLLREYVTMIAGSYHHNPFHNFEHACHVSMSVNKLLSRVVTPDLAATGDGPSAAPRDREVVAAEIHNFTHGLTSDPLAVFALVFAALIHDADHQGISNIQLAKEQPEMAEHYRHKSIAEQNSLDIAWDILMADRFVPLRKYIFGTEAELLRFRQLIVNVVLATDIFDKELGQLRKDRWERAFHGQEVLSSSIVNDLRATIVIEHIIQASDVAHTMQHWHVYQKWNRKLFMELHEAYKAGRMGADPSTFWYNGEIGFFDNYVIPLAKKLKECNVFGVSSDEYLGYALRNREEWKERGEEIVKDLIRDAQGGYRSSHHSVPDSFGSNVKDVSALTETEQLVAEQSPNKSQ